MKTLNNSIQYDNKRQIKADIVQKLVKIKTSCNNNVKFDNLQYNTVGRWVDGMIIPPSDGPMFILIDFDSGSVTLT